MDAERQEAYRHLLYAVLVQMRQGDDKVTWWSPASWRRVARDWQRNKAIANCFHNLAFFSAHKFEAFEEDRFWQDVAHFGQSYDSHLAMRYRMIFDEYVAGRAAHL